MSRISNSPFCVSRTPSLLEISRTSQIGFDPWFLRLDPRRVPFGRYYDRADELISCLSDGELPLGVTKVDPTLQMYFLAFEEYGGFLEHKCFLHFVRGGLYTLSVNGHPFFPLFFHAFLFCGCCCFSFLSSLLV